jgi:hypothetical protein
MAAFSQPDSCISPRSKENFAFRYVMMRRILPLVCLSSLVHSDDSVLDPVTAYDGFGNQGFVDGSFF